MTSFLHTVLSILKKEVKEHIKTKRLIIIGSIFAFAFIIISFYGGILTGQGSNEPSYKSGANKVLLMALPITAYFPGLLSIAISYQSIAGERSRKSLILIISKPIQNSAIYVGKFLSSFCAICMVYLIVVTISYISIVLASGIVPSLTEVLYAYGSISLILLSSACWVAFTMFLSVSIKNPTTVIITSILTWLVILPVVSNAGLIYYSTTERNDQIQNNIDIIVTSENPDNNTIKFHNNHAIAYTVYNESSALMGFFQNGSYQINNVPIGKYSWRAHLSIGDVSGTLFIDGMHSFSVSYKDLLYISLPSNLNVTMERDGRLLRPTNNESNRNVRNYAFRGQSDTYNLNIKNGTTTIFSGNYTFLSNIDYQNIGNEKLPSYIKYIRLINPDNAASAYKGILNQDMPTEITPSEGITALFGFFIIFILLGIFLFSRIELI